MFTLSHRFVEAEGGEGGRGLCVCVFVCSPTPMMPLLPPPPGQGVIESVAVISVRGGSPAASLTVLHLPSQSQQSLGGHVQDARR